MQYFYEKDEAETPRGVSIGNMPVALWCNIPPHRRMARRANPAAPAAWHGNRLLNFWRLQFSANEVDCTLKKRRILQQSTRVLTAENLR